MKDEGFRDAAYWTLPLNERIIEFNVGQGVVKRHPLSELVEFFNQLQSVGLSFSKLNNIRQNNPYGHFILSETRRVIGFSLMPAEAYDFENYTAPLGIACQDINSVVNTSFLYRIHDAPWFKMEESKISVQTLDPLLQIPTLEFIDFGVASFSSGVWDSLAKIASQGSLKGVVVFRSADMLALRSDTVIPEIRGLVVHVRKSEEILGFGHAFPNLSYACVCISDPSLIFEMMDKNTLAQAFPNLKSLSVVRGDYLEPSKWYKTLAETMDERNRHYFFPSAFPKSLEWLYIGDNLLIRHDMQMYESLASDFKMPRKGKRGQLQAPRNVDVVFSGIGFAGGYARSLMASEPNKQDKFWRCK